MIIKGQKIDGRYQIIRTIGEGGMANVYLAYDTILEREVAVKILRGDLSNDEKFVKRFQREAKAASSLNHPNIVEMYDVGEDDGNYFIVMEYVNGKTLKSLIKKRGSLSLSETIDIMLQLTDGIACAHDSYIIHRDLKPQNVMILEDGRVKITDFGIAVALNSAELTQTNSVMGSVHYLPPEQANGSGATVKSDIYSLGILMYELLTGKLPFKGENAVEIAIKQMKEKIPSVVAQNPNIPQSVENIVLRACAKNPENRYETVVDMHEDLRTCLLSSRANEARIEYEYPDIEGEEVHKTKPIEVVSKKKIKEKEIIEKDEKDEKIEELENEVKKLVLKDEKGNKEVSKYKTVVSIVGVVTLFVVVGLLIAFFGFLKFSKKSTVVLPDISDMTKEEAGEKLDKVGVYYTWNKVSSSDIEEGKVVGYTSLKAGSKVKKDRQISVDVSSGLGGVEIEDYTKHNVNIVKIDLENNGIKVITTAKKVSNDTDEYKDFEEGYIISQSKKAGSRLDKGGTIELVYATLVTAYPDFTNGDWDKEKIQGFCDDNEIECLFVEKESDKKPGTILSQGRKAGTEVRKNSTVNVTIAKSKSSSSQVVDDDEEEEKEEEQEESTSEDEE